MSSVNKVILLGNVGRDPEIRYTPTGMAIANVGLATSMRRKDKSSGEMVETTSWHRLKFFDRLAEVVGEYVKKGGRIYVEGRLEYGQYEKEGVTVYTTDVIVTDLQLLGGPRDDQGSAPAAPPARPPAAAPRAPAPAPRPPAAGGSGFDDMDDDIPFASPHAEHDPMSTDRKAKRAQVTR